VSSVADMPQSDLGQLGQLDHSNAFNALPTGTDDYDAPEDNVSQFSFASMHLHYKVKAYSLQEEEDSTWLPNKRRKTHTPHTPHTPMVTETTPKATPKPRGRPRLRPVEEPEATVAQLREELSHNRGSTQSGRFRS
jgi:hypothetical protein